ncbi:hypothetical protein [Cytobacillus sp.]|nr:hypothetical protein [Cytobacillus sp.]
MDSEEFVTIVKQADQKTPLNHTAINTNSIIHIPYQKKAMQ